jgi:hydrogenase maturation factor
MGLLDLPLCLPLDLPLELLHEIFRRAFQVRGVERGHRLRLVNSQFCLGSYVFLYLQVS